MKGFFKQMNRTGIGKMYLCSDICDVERCSQILLDVGFMIWGAEVSVCSPFSCSEN